MLYPSESINEKFLFRLRECVLGLNEKHPLKRWVKTLSTKRITSISDQKMKQFLSEIVNTSYNLITDIELRKKIIDILVDMPENSIPEKLLRSYFFLIIGNVTRSDNLIKEILNSSPFSNWHKKDNIKNIFHDVSIENMDQILKKFSKHPTDRRVFQLLVLYFRNFYNDELLVKKIQEFDTNEVESKIGLKSTMMIAPSLVYFLRFIKLSESDRILYLRKNPINQEQQSFWIWPFINIDPLVSGEMFPELKRIEKYEELWFIYLMHNEKLFDLFAKLNRKSFLPSRRSYLKKVLDSPEKFHLSLYKLIEFGDLNPELVDKVVEHYLNE
jgi:hypothetical protein